MVKKYFNLNYSYIIPLAILVIAALIISLVPTPVMAATASLTLTSPNGGESWQAGTTKMITWSYTGSPGGKIKIQLIKAGAVYSTLTSSRTVGSGGKGSYSWAIPSTLASGSAYAIKITSTSNAAYTDTSNAYFTIIGPGIKVISPNGGENWQAGTTKTITWSYTGNPGTYVKIDLLKAGAVNSTLASSQPKGAGGSGSYSWTIPTSLASGNDYAIKITSTSNSIFTDPSDNSFIINPAFDGPVIIIAAYNSPDKSSAKYKCDGKDDQIEINTAIVSLKGLKGYVQLLAGRFTISAPILVNDNLTLFGQGENTELFLTNDSNRSMIEDLYGSSSGRENVFIHDLYLNGNAINQSEGKKWGDGYAITRSGENAIYENLLIKNMWAGGIRHLSGNYAKITNNVIINCPWDGISLLGSFNSEITNNKITNCSTLYKDAGRGNCIDLYSGGNLLVSSNQINGGGILSQIGSWDTPDCKYVNNICVDGMFMGIGPKGDRSEILNNTVTNSSDNGIDTRGGNYNRIEGNTINKVNGSTENENAGICLNGSWTICKNNTISYAGRTGIYTGSNTGNYIGYNTISNCGYIGTYYAGIMVKNWNVGNMIEKDLIVERNICFDNQKVGTMKYGIQLIAGISGSIKNIQILDNDFSRVTSYGIKVWNSKNMINPIYKNNSGGIIIMN